MTLGPVEELKYDDGSSFYSPSSYHRMIRHSIKRQTVLDRQHLGRAAPRGTRPVIHW